MSDATAWETVRESLNALGEHMNGPGLTALASLQAAYEAMERELSELGLRNAELRRRLRDAERERNTAERRVKELEAALREIAASQGKVTKPLRHAKIARRALEKEEQ